MVKEVQQIKISLSSAMEQSSRGSNQGLNLILVGSIENTNQRGRLNNQKVIDKEETRC